MLTTHPFFMVALLIGLVIATYRDISIREVPDTLTYGLITLGLLGGLILSLVYSDIWFFLDHLFGFLAGLVIGLLMFYARQWGGGDAKLIMGVGAILGFNVHNFQMVSFLVLLIFLGAVYGFIHTLALAVIHRKKFKKVFMKRIREPKIHKLRKGLVTTGIFLIIIIIFVPVELKILLGVVLLGLYLMVYSWIFIRAVEDSLLIKKYPVSKLTEGDWIIEAVKKGRKTIVPAKNTGVTLEQIKAIKKAKIKTVLVKEGIPFVPAFLLSYIVLLLLQWMTKADLAKWLFG